MLDIWCFLKRLITVSKDDGPLISVVIWTLFMFISLGICSCVTRCVEGICIVYHHKSTGAISSVIDMDYVRAFRLVGHLDS